MINNFNLIDEPWIPVADVGLVSLKRIFSDESLRTLGGTPMEKIAIMKLLLAIAQSAATPESEAEWLSLREDFPERCLSYLDQWHSRFCLYGDKPFLQFDAVRGAELKSYGTVMPDVATGNTTRLTQFNLEKPLDNAQRALLLLCQMSLALGGKKTDNSIVLSPGYQGKTKPNGKPTTGRPGPSVAHMGILHSFALGSYLVESIWYNLLTQKEIQKIGLFSGGLGVAPWEVMPEGEDCLTAQALKASLMGRLIPLCRFCLLSDEGMHLTEGLQHLGYKEGLFDPSATIKVEGKALKVVWVNPEHRPWRQLTAILSFIAKDNSGGCHQLQFSLKRASLSQKGFGVWSGGLKVSSNAGEQYASGKDDTVESTLLLPQGATDALWFECYSQEIQALEALSKRLYGAVSQYFKHLNKEGKAQAAQASSLFWQYCEREAQSLLFHCDQPDQVAQLRKEFSQYLYRAFDHSCPNVSARQLDAWAKSRPSLGDYLK